jgi:SulP family sulfate permease
MRSYLRFLFSNVRGDLFGGITTGIVALPLALALGVASGAGAAAGLYSAIFQGAIAALFGGTPAQVSGPTAGMTAVLIGVYQALGTKGLFAAMFLGGLFQLLFAALRVGKYIHYLPKPVVAGFTNGIAVLIFWKQFKDIFIPGGPMYTPVQMALAAAVVILMLIWPRITRAVPGSLVALVGATAVVLIAGLPVKLLGPMPSGLPAPQFPLAGMDWSAAPTLVKAGLVIALLGTIESLLSAIVVDEMAGTRHQSDREIFGQGLANAIAPVFGGLAGTGAIVRSAVNVRAGGRTPLAALIHSAMILGITLGLGKYAALIPVPALWGILMATAFGMVEWESIHDLFRAPKSDSAVMVVTTVLTVVEDLTVGVAAGLLLSFVLFGFRMSRSPVHRADLGGATVLALEGPLFFGMAKNFLDMVEAAPAGVPQVWDFTQVTAVDATGAEILRKARQEAERQGKKVVVVGLRPEVQRVLERLEVMAGWEEQTVLPSRREALSTLGLTGD